MGSRGERPLLTRREILKNAGLTVAGVGVGAAGVGVATTLSNAPDDSSPRSPAPVDSGAPSAVGPHQAGVAIPTTPASHAQYTVVTFSDAARADLPETLSTLGERIIDFANEHAGSHFSATVGLGPTLVGAIDSSLLGNGLPAFADDAAIDPRLNGGDLLLIVAADEPAILGDVGSHLLATLPPHDVRWTDFGFRGPGSDGLARNPLGFVDGIIVPRTPEELDTHVWISSGVFAGGTVCVVRRVVLDTDGFRSLRITEQEAKIGRRRIDGAPLSGGATHDEIDLLAKTPEGDLVTPLRSHARAAHPSFTGSSLMLRRSYACLAENGTASGLLFTSFHRDLRTFIATQQRLDEADDLRAYMTPTASGAWVILPGFTSTQPLGSLYVDAIRGSGGEGSESE